MQPQLAQAKTRRQTGAKARAQLTKASSLSAGDDALALLDFRPAFQEQGDHRRVQRYREKQKVSTDPR